MNFNFCIRGRLGNAIFRYMATAIMCLFFNGNYTININEKNNCSDEYFIDIIKSIIKKDKIFLNEGLNMIDFYQHDLIYKLYKHNIIQFINNHPDHYILTDGINAGDKNCEKFYMIHIINTPILFTKKYKNVLHIRLEDFVTHNLYIKKERVVDLLKKNIITNELCIVCKKPNSEFENNYIKFISNYMESINVKTILEHNDTLTDFYIMKEAELLICSKSTLSWCAAFFSDKIKKCYLPDYEISCNSTCKNPIDNTELY